ncbi:unnamed protein product [Ceratitis capitata]|uniref:(Mediterranean fruit fly) hypothetical protein n=1 Tax=Ceratitis capitata TaxID=7213 RepID=A0A811UVU9_CERCA|nr:unnamed protein product [Ceratitis capitata]
MIITVKTMKREKFAIEFDPQKTVFQLKEKIFSERGANYVVENQKLIYDGMTLKDEHNINSYNIEEKKAVMLILKRDFENYIQKPEKADFSVGISSQISDGANNNIDHGSKTVYNTLIQKPDELTLDVEAVSSSSDNDLDEGNKSEKSVANDGVATDYSTRSNNSILSSTSGEQPFSKSSNRSGGSENSNSTYSSGDLAGVFSNISLQSLVESSLPKSKEHSHTIESIVEMGFSREIVEQAMSLNFNNPERAVESLISGQIESLIRLSAGKAAENCVTKNDDDKLGDFEIEHAKFCNKGLDDNDELMPTDDGTTKGKAKNANTVTRGKSKPGTSRKAWFVGSDGMEDNGIGAVLGPVESNTSIISSGSSSFRLSERSTRSGDSETSHSTFSSGDLVGVFSNTSLQSRSDANMPTNEEYNRAVDSMMEMGFSRDTAVRAMAASFNSFERALEYLISGMSENSDSINTNTISEDNNYINNCERRHISSNEGGGDGVENSDHRNEQQDEEQMSLEGNQATLRYLVGPERGVAFEMFRNQPQFLLMRSLMYQNPDVLHEVLQQIGQTNPALLQLISENQDAFLSMLGENMEEQTNNDASQEYPRRMTAGRRAQLAAAVRAAAGGDGLHVRSVDTAPGAGGDGLLTHQRPGESGDAGADTVPHSITLPRLNRVAERRAAAVDAFLRERAAAAATVAALTADTSGIVQSNTDECRNDISATCIDTERYTDVDDNALFLTGCDEEAIQRLKALGFAENLVLEAYLACQKDEESAANLLISSSNENLEEV